MERTFAAGALTTLLWATVAAGQMPVPHYQSPIEQQQQQAPVNEPQPQLTLPTPSPITPNGQVVEDVIARVNDQVIDRSDVERGQKDLLQEEEQGKMSPSDVAERQKNLLRDMIDQQLLLSRGKQLDINVDTQVVQQLDEIRKQNHLDSMDALEKAVRDSGISYEDFKANIRNSLITQTVVRDEVSRNLRLTPKEEQAYYEKHKEEYAQPEQIRLSEILIPTPANATDAQIAQAKAKADEVDAKLKAGAKFADLAKQYSGGPTADKGGDLGMFKRGDLHSQLLEDKTFSLKAGESTAPIRTRQGYVLLGVTEHIAAGIPPLSDVDQQVQEAMYREAIQPALRAYLTKLREDAYIKIEPGFVDSGASPKETAPVYVAYTPPAEKKKKVQQKERLDAGRIQAKAVSASAKTDAKPEPTIASTEGGSGANEEKVSSVKKHKKIRREKVRFGQAPQETLPAGPEETVASGADQGPGATSSLLAAPGEAIAPIGSNNVDVDPLAPKPPQQKKTRLSDEEQFQIQVKKNKKLIRIREKAAAVPPAMTEQEKLTQKIHDAPMDLSGNDAAKRVKDGEKERLQDKAPAPPPPKPVATPIPPRSVRENGEPVVTPAPDPSSLPPVKVPSADTTGGSQQTAPTPPTSTQPQ